MLRLAIIEDQRMLQECMFAAIQKGLDVELVGYFQSGKEVRANRAALAKADVGLLDLNYGEEQAFDFLPELQAMVPELKLIWVTCVSSEYLLGRAVAAKLPGFVHKNDPTEVLITAIERVAAGDRFLSPTVDRMLTSGRASANHYSKLLSEREQELLVQLGRGLSNSEAGAMLGLSPSTVQTHRRNIMRRLDLHTAVELQTYALRMGFTTQEKLRSGSQK